MLTSKEAVFVDKSATAFPYRRARRHRSRPVQLCLDLWPLVVQWVYRAADCRVAICVLKKEGRRERNEVSIETQASAVGDSECMWHVNAAFSQPPSCNARLYPQCWQSRCVVWNCCGLLLAWTWQQRNHRETCFWSTELLSTCGLMRAHDVCGASTVCSNNNNHRCVTFVSMSLAVGVGRAERLSGCLLENVGDGCMSGGVWPNALRPRCWDNSCWYATGLMECGNGNEGLEQKRKRWACAVCANDTIVS